MLNLWRMNRRSRWIKSQRDNKLVGLTVYDQLVQDLYDDVRGVTYEAWSCINDENMAERSRNPGGNRVIYSIKATAQKNSEMAVLMRDCLRRGKLRLLVDDVDGCEMLEQIKAFQRLPIEEQEMFTAPYYQTTAFVNEVVNLEYEMSGTNIRVFEVAGARKDRYSSVSYGNYIASEIERDRRRTSSDDFKRAPNCVSAVDF